MLTRTPCTGGLNPPQPLPPTTALAASHDVFARESNMSGFASEYDVTGTSPDSTASLFGAFDPYGTSPTTPFEPFPKVQSKHSISSCLPPLPQPPRREAADLLHVSLPVLLGCSEMLGHMMEDRSDIAKQQDARMLAQLQGCTAASLRDDTQRPLFTVAPLDILVTRDMLGRNQFHVIEINGTGISGLTNMSPNAVEDVLRSFSELPSSLPQADCVVLVASSGQETYPPVSRTLHEKVLYVEALKRGFEETGRHASITNMTRLEKRPEAMPGSGVTIVLGYMKQFRANFMLEPSGRLMLLGRQVHAAINDRFVLNTVYQFNHGVDLQHFTGHNAGFAAGADKGVAYTLYNQFFGSEETGGHFDCMAPAINFRRAHTREELLAVVQDWLAASPRPAVIKPQGTGCGHGIEFFFRSADPAAESVATKVDRALHTVANNYNLQCGGLPFTVCEYLDTATIQSDDPAFKDKHKHKYELRVVVYRTAGELRAFPSIAKVAREAYDPLNPDNKKSLINNITTSAKETSQAGQEFLLPLANAATLNMLGISEGELTELCSACTHFMRYVVDQVQDNPELFGLPA